MADPWAAFPKADAAPADAWAAFPVADKPASVGDTAYDVAASGAAGVGKGTAQLLGGLGDVREGVSAATSYLGNRAGIDPASIEQLKSFGSMAFPKISGAPTSSTIQKGIEKVTGEFHKPATELGKGAEAIGEFVPGALGAAATGGGSIAGNLIRYAGIPGAVSALAEKYLPDNAYKPYAKAGLTVASTIPNPARLVTPLPASEAKREAVDVLRNEGVTSLTAGQKTGSEGLKYLESASSTVPLGGNRAKEIEAEGQRQFTDATLRRAGTGGLATPEVLAQNQKRLGSAFEDLAARNNLVPDNQFINDVVDAARNYKRVPDSQQRSMVQGYVDDIIGHVNAGQMPGPQYQEMRSRLSRQANQLRGTDPTLSESLRDMRNALDSAMARSISPEDQQAWQAARREYSAQKVIEKVASRAGEAASEGQITPPNLRNTVAGENRGAYARGEGQFADLARAGANVMTPLPNSGTAQRLNAFNILDWGKALLAAPGAITSRAITSRPGQAYLSNQLMNGALPNSPAARSALVLELLQQNKQLVAPHDQ